MGHEIGAPHQHLFLEGAKSPNTRHTSYNTEEVWAVVGARGVSVCFLYMSECAFVFSCSVFFHTVHRRGSVVFVSEMTMAKS